MPDRERERPAAATIGGPPVQDTEPPRPARAQRVGIGPPRGLLFVSAAIGTFGTAISGCLAWYGSAGSCFQWCWHIAAGLIALSTALKWVMCLTDARFAVLATAEGITRRLPLGERRLTVSWELVGGCRVYTEASASAPPTSTTWCAILDREGNELFRVNVTHADGRDCDRLVAMVRERQGTSAIRHELLAADAPTGRGTELVPAEPPAGRGTEPEASRRPDVSSERRPV